MKSNPLRKARLEVKKKAREAAKVNTVKVKIVTKSATSQTQTFSKLVKSTTTTKRSLAYGKQVLGSVLKGEKLIPSHSQYEFVKEIGEGAQGVVFTANQCSEFGIKKRIAIKVLRAHHDERSIKRLVNEAKLLQRLTQGRIVEMLALEKIVQPGEKSIISL